MIDSIKGILKLKEPTRVVIDCGGIGYELFIPFSTYQKLSDLGEMVYLYSHLVHRETAMELFGFSTEKERDLFRKLITVSGIGPKIGIAVLSGMEVDKFVNAVQKGESDYLVKINGIGNKTAQRLIVELQDKVKDIVISEAETDDQSEALNVLLALGYKKPQAESAIKKVLKTSGKISVERIVKEALKEI